MSLKPGGAKQRRVLTEVKFLFALLLTVTAQSVTITTKQEELRRGETVTLECQAGSSNPQASIFWKLGTQRYNKSSFQEQNNSNIDFFYFFFGAINSFITENDLIVPGT